MVDDERRRRLFEESAVLERRLIEEPGNLEAMQRFREVERELGEALMDDGETPGAEGVG